MIETFSIIKILILSTTSFVLAMAWTPLLTNFLYKYKLGKSIRDEGSAPIFFSLHAKKSGAPTMGGVLIWGTTLFLAIIFAWVYAMFPESIAGRLNFLNRGQTLLPLGVLVASALI